MPMNSSVLCKRSYIVILSYHHLLTVEYCWLGSRCRLFVRWCLMSHLIILLQFPLFTVLIGSLVTVADAFKINLHSSHIPWRLKRCCHPAIAHKSLLQRYYKHMQFIIIDIGLLTDFTHCHQYFPGMLIVACFCNLADHKVKMLIMIWWLTWHSSVWFFTRSGQSCKSLPVLLMSSLCG